MTHARPPRDRLASILAPDVLDALAEFVDERLANQTATHDAATWLDRKAAAAYLSGPISRLEKARDIPCHRWDGRVLYNRRELDDWIRSQ